MADTPDTISISPGSTTVTGYLTQFLASEGDLFLAGGFIAEVASRPNNTTIQLKLPWGGPSLSGVRYGLIDIGPYLRQTFTLNRAVIDLIQRFDIAAPFKFDAYGTIDQRDGFNNQSKGFVYLSLDGPRARLYLKLQNTNSAGDWSSPIAIGSGDQVDFEDAVLEERSDRIADVESVRALVRDSNSGNSGAVADLRMYVDQRDSILSQVSALLRADLTAETAARSAAVDGVTSKIAAEESARFSADAAIRSEAIAESSARKAAESVLGSRIDAEASTRFSADAAQNSRIDAEAATRDAGDRAAQASIAAEAATRASEDSAIRSDALLEKSERKAADVVLGGKIDAEAATARSAEQVIRDNLVSETNRAIAVESATNARTRQLDIISPFTRFLFGIRDSDGRIPAGLTKTGQWFMSKPHLAATPIRFGKARLFALADRSGHVALAVDRFGGLVVSSLKLLALPSRKGRKTIFAMVDRVGNISLSITRAGEVAVARLRLGKIPARLGSARSVTIQDRNLRVVAAFSRLGELVVARIRLTKMPVRNGASRVLVVQDARRRVAVSISRLGELVLFRIRLRSLPARFGGLMCSAIIDRKGNVIAAILRNGLIRLTIEPLSLARSEALARLDASVALSAGARGTISDTQRIRRNLIRFYSDVMGATFPFLMLTDQLPGTAQLLASGTIRGSGLYGQSWEVSGLNLVSGLLIDDGEPFSAYCLAVVENGRLTPSYPQGTGFNVQQIAGLCGVGGLIRTAGIGMQASVARQKLREFDRRHKSPIVTAGGPVGGKTWEELRPGGEFWPFHVATLRLAQSKAAAHGVKLRYDNIGFTHQAAVDGMKLSNGSLVDYYAQIGEMVAAHDALDLNGDGSLPHYFTDQTAPISEQTQAQAAILLQAQFALDNTARVHCIGPRYPYPYDVGENIHHSALGYTLIGELRGYAQYVVLDLGLPWDFFRPTAITVSGNTVTLALTRPYGMGDVVLDTVNIDAAPGMGLAVRIGGSARTVSNIALGADSLSFTFSGAAAASGSSVEVSNAFYGPGSPYGTHAGCWGNIKRAGPPSTRVEGRTIDTWLSVFRQTVTAS